MSNIVKKGGGSRTMSSNHSEPTRRSEINLAEQHPIVGRERECGIFLELLAEEPLRERILNLYGTGGIGKSFLLDEFRRLAAQAGHRYLSMDCRIFRTPSDLCLYLLRLLDYPTQTIEQDADTVRLTEICLMALSDAAGRGKTIMALDTFEDIGEMDHWLRESFLPHLDPRILVILSGRLPLGALWISSSTWRHKIYRMPLEDLNYSSVKLYAEHLGIRGEELIQQVWARTKGHPLTLSLLVATTLARTSGRDAFMGQSELFAHVVASWLREVPDPEMRGLVEAAAVIRVFNQELLSYVLDKEVPFDQFRRLADYSFVQRIDRGWSLHDLLREAIHEELQVRVPDYYDALRKRCIVYYYRKLRGSTRTKSVSWENAEWFYYMGNQLIRSLFYQQSTTYRFEALSPSNWDDVNRYIEQRYRTVKEFAVHRIHPATQQTFAYIYTVEDSLHALKHIPLEELYALDPSCVKLVRDSHGTQCGLFIIIPINERTLSYLLTQPLSSAYFSSLSESELDALRAPGHQRSGYFIQSLDVCDPSDEAMMQATGIAFITHMLSAGFVVAAPPPHPMPRDILLSLGCEIPDVVHYGYDGQTPTPYYVIDTRGKKLQDYLSRMISSIGLADELEESSVPSVLLTKRETEVVDLLVKGISNAEIAGLLYLSEATVKKHVAHIYKKLNVKSRGQLIRLYAQNIY